MTPFIRTQTDFQPRYGIVRVPVFSGLTDEIDTVAEIPCGEHPALSHFHRERAQGQARLLLPGRKPVWYYRFHYYEGYTAQKSLFPRAGDEVLGIELLILSNAAGSANQHIHTATSSSSKTTSICSDNPARYNDERLTNPSRYAAHTYDRQLNAKGLEIASQTQHPPEGVLPGTARYPQPETPTEYNFFHIIGY